MELDFSVLTVNELMDELGKGGCKPGSGSAAALQGMISAKLALTVITITNRPKFKESYKTALPEMNRMATDISGVIFPKLEDYFHKDAFHFNKAMDARKATMLAEKNNDFYEYSRLRKLEADELKMAVKIPLEIAEQCVKLARISLYIFNNAFVDVRGDSHVALGGAVASIAGCLSIVQLNLLSFKINHVDYSKAMMDWYDAVRSEYESLKGEVDRCVEILEEEVSEKLKLYDSMTEFLKITKVDRTWTDSQLERIAIRFQKILWEHKGAIWNAELKNPKQMLDPHTIFEKVFDYDFGMFPVLENDNDGTECAGFIDQVERQIVLSGKYSQEVQNFTASHELAHAILHNQPVLHRDVPIDRIVAGTRPPRESQADKLPAFLAMPKAQINETFKELFGVSKLEVNEATAFNFNRTSKLAFRSKVTNRRDFAIKAASAEIYAGTPFRSMAKQYGMSVLAMARRLEELELIGDVN